LTFEKIIGQMPYYRGSPGSGILAKIKVILLAGWREMGPDTTHSTRWQNYMNVFSDDAPAPPN
jgi:hypothetical protein